MDFDQVTRLPKQCEDLVVKQAGGRDIGSVKALFERFFVGRKALVEYSLDSVERFKPMKLPAQVWREKRGHCFETSLFWLACMRRLGIKARYCEKSSWIDRHGKTWDHAFVNVTLDGKKIQMDPGRRIFGAKFKIYRELNEKQTVGTYYADCAKMLNPYDLYQRKRRLTEAQTEKLARAALRYATLALRNDPKEDRMGGDYIRHQAQHRRTRPCRAGA